MNKKILVMAGILVALTGLLFAMPLTILGAVACPGDLCVTHMGNPREYKEDPGQQSGWRAPDDCSASTYTCNDPEEGCCLQCENWGYDKDHIVGYCASRCPGVYYESYDYDCFV